MNKKNLDELFQEKLKDLREIPDEKVWRSIEKSLDQRKKSKRVIPIWWKLGGVAAVLALALLVFNPFSESEVPVDTISDVEKTATPVNSDVDKDKMQDARDGSEIPASVISASEKNEQLPSEQSGTGRNKLSPVEGKTGESNEPDSRALTNSDPTIEAKPQDELVNSASESARKEINNLGAAKDNKETGVFENEESLANAVALQKKDNTISPDESEISETKKTSVLSENKSEVADQSQDIIDEDSSGKKSIFDEINKQQEEETLADVSNQKWSVGPSVAPVYFSSFGDGSPIHSNFTSNSKSGNVNLSYGLAIGYELTDNLSLRSGIHKVDYGYDTNDITFSSSLVASTREVITNIDYTSNSRNLVVESSLSRETVQDFASNDIVAQNPSRSGSMVQEFGYIEVPMELNYALVNRKFNLNITGGISSLFLVNNTVTLESAGSSTEMGEANNLNNVNFSTNIGLGFNYELNDKMKVHLEPMFKYQLNMFSDVEGDFQPYTLGVYTGVSFKF